MHLVLFLTIILVVSAVNALIRPLPPVKMLRECIVTFMTTVLGMGAVALAIHVMSMQK